MWGGGSVCLPSFHDFPSTFRSLAVPPSECAAAPFPPPFRSRRQVPPRLAVILVHLLPDSFCFPHLPREPASEEVRGSRRSQEKSLERGTEEQTATESGRRREEERAGEQLPPTGAAGRLGEIMDHPFMYSSCFWGARISSGPQGQMPFSPAAARLPVNLAATYCCCCFPPPLCFFFFFLFFTKISLMHDRY